MRVLSHGLLVVVSFLIAGQSAGDWLQTYELDGASRVVTPVGTDVFPFVGRDETPVWSTGFLTDDLTPDPNTNTDVVLTLNEVLGPVLTASQGVISYSGAPEVTTNSITILFTNGDSSGLDSVGDGDIEIQNLDFHYVNFTNPVFASLIAVFGGNDTDVSGGIGVLQGTTVEEWVQDSTGLAHNEIMCHGNCALAGNMEGTTDPLLPVGLLQIFHDETDAIVAIDLTGEFPESTSGAVPESLGMTFSEDFTTVTFEVSGPVAVGDDRTQVVFSGVAIPEPSLAALQFVALLSLIGLGRRRGRRSAR